jgi:hypothetical protein
MKKIMALFGYVPKHNITVEVNKQDMENIKKFLHYSFEPIGYRYDGLTPTEKKLVGRTEFERIIKILK